ncbi:MAG: helix-turn-helix domain-containing protein [Verrucomicrobiaceae bacterium]
MPTAFGQMLAAARESRGLSLEDAAHETRIPVHRVRLLESGNLAAFGNLTYARSFIRAYSEFLDVDPGHILDSLPGGGVLGGERDYRYLTHSHGPWVRERAAHPERLTATAVNRPHHIKSPLPAGIAVFVLILAGTGMWGMHVAESRRKAEPTTLKQAPSPTSRRVDFPVSVRRGLPVD